MHVAVMPGEVIEVLAPERGGLFVDCTVGLGGHARRLLEAGASRVIGIDRDRSALAIAASELAEWRDQIDLVHADFRRLAQVLADRNITQVDGVLADLGVSSLQLDAEGRGFSFRRDEPLDMRMDTSQGDTAADLLAHVGEKELADLIYRFGEERSSRRIARALVHARSERPLVSTAQVADVVRRVTPRKGFQRIDPATRTFQALRIWVNRELEGLAEFLETAAMRLARGGRLGVITFHSLEDRIVKHTFRALAATATASRPSKPAQVRVLTKRPILPTAEEVKQNPRSRSAKLRAVERV